MIIIVSQFSGSVKMTDIYFFCNFTVHNYVLYFIFYIQDVLKRIICYCNKYSSKPSTLVVNKHLSCSPNLLALFFKQI